MFSPRGPGMRKVKLRVVSFRWQWRRGVPSTKSTFPLSVSFGALFQVAAPKICQQRCLATVVVAHAQGAPDLSSQFWGGGMEGWE